MEQKRIEAWLDQLKNHWFHKNIEGVVSLFEHTTFYQETPFMEPFTTIEEIRKEWESVKEATIENIEFVLLAYQNKTAIVEWRLSQNKTTYDGIYEIHFNDDFECVYFKSWEMEEPPVPESVLEYGFDFDWKEEDVWKLEYEKEKMDIHLLEWHFDVPFWNFSGIWYSLKPRTVLENPKEYSKEYQRIMNADINYPIDIMENKGRYVILDGLHRLAKCKILGMEQVMVRIIPRSEIKNLSI